MLWICETFAKEEEADHQAWSRLDGTDSQGKVPQVD